MSDITLPRQSWRILFARLNNPEGWCKSVKSYSNTINILSKPVFEDLEDLIIPSSHQQIEELLANSSQLTDAQIKVLELFKSNAAAKTWLEEPLTESLSDKQIATVKLCLQPAMEQGSLPLAPRFMLPILEAFNLNDEE